MTARPPLTPLLDPRFLRKNWAILATWPLVCLFFGAVIWHATHGRIEDEKAFLDKNAMAKSAMLASGYAIHVGQLVGQIDQTLLRLVYHWRHSNGSIRLEDIAATGAYPAEVFKTVAIIDTQGKVVTSTPSTYALGHHRVMATDASDLEYFITHRTNPAIGLRIGVVTFGKIFGKPVIQFTRRLSDRDGAFQGVVLLAVDPDFLTSFSRVADIGSQGLIALIGKDGALRASHIGDEPAPAGGSPFTRLPEFSTAERGSNLIDGAWFSDGSPRFVTAREVVGFPLTAVAGISRDESFADFTRNWSSYRQFTYASSLLLFFFAIAATLLVTRLALRQHTQQMETEAYRLATESSQECFYMLRSIYGKNGEIIDFQLADCNERGAALFGLTRDTFIGARVTGMYKDDYLNRMMSVYLHAMKQGLYEDEYRVPGNSPLIKSQWLQRKFVRSDNNLAMTVRDITESKAYQQSLLRMANEDALTSLPNRHWLADYLPQATERAGRHGLMLGLLFIDLDGFKAINDRYGHQTGDLVLCEVARRIQSILRQDDKAVRLGGDEFLVLVEQVLSRSLLEQVATRLCAALNQPLLLDAGTLTLGASIGISVFPEHGNTLDTLLNHADAAMYSAKRTGKGKFAFFSPEDGTLLDC